MSESNRPLANRILIGLGVGIVAGIATLIVGRFSPEFLAFMRHVSTTYLDPLGQIFLRLLFFVVIPLVFASLAAGVVQLGRLDKLGPLATRTFAFFFLNMAIGTILGLLMMNLLQPGNHLSPEAKTSLMTEFGGAAQRTIATHQGQQGFSLASLVEMFLPKNLFGAFVGNQRNALGEVLPLIVFAILVGAAGLGLPETRRKRLLDGLETVSDLMTGIVHFALKLAPYVVILDAATQVNINTAAPEVIAARFARMSLADARALVGERERSYFVNIGDPRLDRFRSGGLPGDAQISTASRYFLVRGQVKLDRANTRLEALVRRGERWETPPRIVWQREL